jgi:hypothetical protein
MASGSGPRRRCQKNFFSLSGTPRGATSALRSAVVSSVEPYLLTLIRPFVNTVAMVAVDVKMPNSV